MNSKTAKIVEVLVYVQPAKVKDLCLGNVPKQMLRRQEIYPKTWLLDSPTGTIFSSPISSKLYNFDFSIKLDNYIHQASKEVELLHKMHFGQIMLDMWWKWEAKLIV